MNKKFEDYMLQKNDEIDNAAYALAAALIRTSPEQTNEEVLEWDIDLISSITSAAIGELKKFGKDNCYPFTDDKQIPCFRSDHCKNKNCPHENAAIAEILSKKE